MQCEVKKMRSVVIIPARYSSTRYPGKPLVKLLGKPMLIWVCELCEKAVGADNVYVATDSKQIGDVVQENGYQVVYTSSECKTGTDRLAEAAEQISADIYINVQGDEPLVDPGDIKKAIELKEGDIGAIYNGFCWLDSSEDPDNVNIPKVITNESERLLYMSRKSLPGYKEVVKKPVKYKKQVCIYAFTGEELQLFRNFGRKSLLENYEDIEILRFLEFGKEIKMFETQPGSLAVDVPSDVGPVEAALKKIHGI